MENCYYYFNFVFLTSNIKAISIADLVSNIEKKERT